MIAGLTRYVTAGHIARAALEAIAFQSREVADAMNADSGVALTELKVDGGMVANETLMQFQADILGVPVIRPKVAETTALGAAYAAGLATGFWAVDRRAARQLGRRSALGAADGRRAPARPRWPRGRRRSRGRWTGSRAQTWRRAELGHRGGGCFGPAAPPRASKGEFASISGARSPLDAPEAPGLPARHPLGDAVRARHPPLGLRT